MHRVLLRHATTTAGDDGPRPPAPFLAAWLRPALAWAEPVRAAHLVEHYGHVCPHAWLQRFRRPAPPVDDLIRLDLRAHAPRLRRALDGLLDGARRRGLGDVWGSRDALLAASPTVPALVGRSMFGASMPMVSLGEVEQAAFAASGWSAEDLLDYRLAGHVVHELAHGPDRAWTGGAGPWMVLEAAAAWINLCVEPDHVYAARPAEPVLGLRSALNLAEALLDALGDAGVWRLALTTTDLTHDLGRRAAHALTAATWQMWCRSDAVSFAPEHRRVLDLARLLDLARADTPTRGPLAEALARLEALDEVRPDDALRLPDLLDLAANTPADAVPGWHDSPGAAHEHALRRAVFGMFQVERLQPELAVVASDPPRGALRLDVARGALIAEPRRDDPSGLPAEARVPPALCGALAARGVDEVLIDGATAERADAIADALLELTVGRDAGRRRRIGIDGAAGGAPPRGPRRVHVDARPADPPGALRVPIPPLDGPLHHTDGVITVGSCFADALGQRLAEAAFDAAVNPAGIVYDPVSVARVARLVLDPAPVDVALPDTLPFAAHGRWHSPWHHDATSDVDRDALLRGVRDALGAARARLTRRCVWLLTWGTARVWTHEGAVVAATHGLPADRYATRRLTVAEIVDATAPLLDALAARRPADRVLLSVSPIRHLGQGLEDNQLSKATLRLAADAVAARWPQVAYVPAYEIVLDELRDHRWFDADLAHLRPEATDVVWQRFLDAAVAPSSRAWVRAHAAARHALLTLPRDPVRRLRALDALDAALDALPRSPALPSADALRAAVIRDRATHAALLGEAPAAASVATPSRPVSPAGAPPPRPDGPPAPRSDDALAALTAAIAPGRFVPYEAQGAWVAAVRAALPGVRPRDALRAILDHADALAEPGEALPGLTADLIDADDLPALAALVARHLPRGHLALDALRTLPAPARRDLAALLEPLAGDQRALRAAIEALTGG